MAAVRERGGQQLLRGRRLILCLQTVEIHALMRSVLVDQNDVIVRLDRDIGFEGFSQDSVVRSGRVVMIPGSRLLIQHIVVRLHRVINILNSFFDSLLLTKAFLLQFSRAHCREVHQADIFVFPVPVHRLAVFQVCAERILYGFPIGALIERDLLQFC